MDSIVQWEWGGEYILRSIIYSMPTHTCTSMQTYHQPESPSFCGKPATVHTSFIYPPHSTDGFVVVHLAVSTISGSRSAIGFHSVSLEIACGKNKNKNKKCVDFTYPVRFQKLAGSLKACSRKQVGLKKKKVNFTHTSHATMSLSSDLGALPQGCNNSLLHLSSLYDPPPPTLHVAPLKPTLTVIENTQVCHISFLSSTLCYVQPS